MEHSSQTGNSEVDIDLQGQGVHCTALHCTALHYAALHCTALHNVQEHNALCGIGHNYWKVKFIKNLAWDFLFTRGRSVHWSWSPIDAREMWSPMDARDVSKN
jgi:hypothetical protein